MRTVLVTGFEPFGGEAENPSAQAALALHGRRLAGRELVGAVLPCVFGDALVALRRAIARTRPELVLCVGQAGGRRAISLERVAINVDDARIADNQGARPIDRPIAARGPVGYWSTLPIKAIVAALTDAGIPAEVSQTAGTFVCNHVFYGLMRTLRRREGVRGGFVHVPYLPAQAARAGGDAPSMPLETIVRGLELAIETALRRRRDVRRSGGATR
jgi:pyroglutamyl-peptidase